MKIRVWHSTALLSAIICLGQFDSRADDWPQWRGPSRDGISKETGLAKHWPEQGPPLLWKVEHLGSGYSTPAVVGERLYLQSDDSEREFVKCLATSDGSQIWSTPLGKVAPNQGPQYPGTRSTPTVDGKLLYALGSDGDLACVETETGVIRWQRNLRSDFGGKPGKWAYSESPLIDGDALICAPGGSKATMVALNKNTGDLIWKCEIPGGEEAAYASAIVHEIQGIRQYIQFLQNGLVGVEAKNGKFLWRYDKTAQSSPANIPTPIAHGSHVYSASARGGGGLIELEFNDDGVDVRPIYSGPKLPTSIGGAVRVGEHLYGTTGQALLCVEFLTGEILWEERSVAPGSLCFADGHLYIHGENGDIGLVKATPDGYQEKGRFTPAGQPDRGRGRAWTYPVIANGRLYIRDLGVLWSYDISAAPRTAFK